MIKLFCHLVPFKSSFCVFSNFKVNFLLFCVFYFQPLSFSFSFNLILNFVRLHLSSKQTWDLNHKIRVMSVCHSHGPFFECLLSAFSFLFCCQLVPPHANSQSGTGSEFLFHLGILLKVMCSSVIISAVLKIWNLSRVQLLAVEVKLIWSSMSLSIAFLYPKIKT